MGAFYGDFVLFIIDDMSWASQIIIDAGKIFGGLPFILPLEGNIFAAQDQHTLQTCHKWGRGQHVASYSDFHGQISSQVHFRSSRWREIFSELSCWEATYFS